MSAQLEFDRLKRVWQGADNRAPAFDAQALVERDTRRMKLAMIGPIIVTVVAGGGSVLTALESRRIEDFVLAAGIWVFILSVWLGWLWISRSSWRPLTESTKAYLDLSIQRCISTLRALYFGAALYVIGFASMLIWKMYYFSSAWRNVLTSGTVLCFAFVVTPVLLYMLIVFSRKKRSELANLQRTRFEFENMDGT